VSARDPLSLIPLHSQPRVLPRGSSVYSPPPSLPPPSLTPPPPPHPSLPLSPSPPSLEGAESPKAKRDPKPKPKSTAAPAVAADAMGEAERLALTGGQPALNDVQARYMRERVRPPEEFVIEAIVKKKPQYLDVPTHVAQGTGVAVPTSPSGPQHGPGYSPEIEAARWVGWGGVGWGGGTGSLCVGGLGMGMGMGGICVWVSVWV
jgi:hypothetical protein